MGVCLDVGAVGVCLDVGAVGAVGVCLDVGAVGASLDVHLGASCLGVVTVDHQVCCLGLKNTKNRKISPNLVLNL